MRPPTTAPEPVTLSPARPARRRGRPLTALVLGLGLPLCAGLAACSTQSGYQTQVPYVPADGVPANVGDIQARNLLVVAKSKGAPGIVSGSLNNVGTQPVSVTVAGVNAQGAADAGTTIQVKGGQQQPIQGVQIGSVSAPPGDLTEIVLKTPAGQQNVKVPVLAPEGYYSTITPTAGATGASGASGTATGASGTATGTGTAGPGTTGATTPAVTSSAPPTTG